MFSGHNSSVSERARPLQNPLGAEGIVYRERPVDARLRRRALIVRSGSRLLAVWFPRMYQLCGRARLKAPRDDSTDKACRCSTKTPRAHRVERLKALVGKASKVYRLHARVNESGMMARRRAPARPSLCRWIRQRALREAPWPAVSARVFQRVDADFKSR